MRPLGKAWPRLRRQLQAAGHVCLFLDFDGTLAPLAEHPSKARMPDRARALLKQLRNTPHVSVGIVSGRRLQDLKRCVRVKGLSYIGNHGLEAEGPYGRYLHPAARRSRPLLKQLARKLRCAVEPIPHAWVEDKELPLSVHYRQVSTTHRPVLRRVLRRTVQPYEAKRQVRVCPGKAVWDIRPDVQWDKGTVIQWALRRMHANRRTLVICLGDDRSRSRNFLLFPFMRVN
jgi:trehalose 6-phosphate phosphatase